MQSCEHSHWCISPFRFFGQFLPKYQFGSFPCPQCAIARQLQWWRSQLQKLGIEWRSKVQTGPEILTANKRKSYFFIFLMLPFYCKAMVPGHIQIGGSFKVFFKYPSWLFFKFYCYLSLASHGGHTCYQFRVPRNLRIDIKDRLEEYSQSIEIDILLTSKYNQF